MKWAFLLTVLTVAIGADLSGRALGYGAGGEINTRNARSAAELYAKSCASCHGKDGRAKTFKAKFNQARDLTDRAWHDSVSDERLFNSIMNGRGKRMPAYGKKFSEQEIESLVAFVRGLMK
ncbi:MAG: cytochrome c [Acidobacteriota bacterium]